MGLEIVWGLGAGAENRLTGVERTSKSSDEWPMPPSWCGACVKINVLGMCCMASVLIGVINESDLWDMSDGNYKTNYETLKRTISIRWNVVGILKR